MLPLQKDSTSVEFHFENLEVEVHPGNFITKRFTPKKVVLQGATGSLKSGRARIL